MIDDCNGDCFMDVLSQYELHIVYTMCYITAVYPLCFEIKFCTWCCIVTDVLSTYMYYSIIMCYKMTFNIICNHINLYNHSHFLATPLISQLFHIGHFEQVQTFFFYS